MSIEEFVKSATELELKEKQSIFLVAYDGANDQSIMAGDENILGNAIWNMMNDPRRRRVLTGGVISWLKEQGLLNEILLKLIEDDKRKGN